MFPLRDINPTRRKPLLTYGLLGVTTGVFLLQGYLLVGVGVPSFSAFCVDFGVIPRRLLSAPAMPTPLTYMFLHGGLLHFAGNMWFLKVFGDNVEDALGHGRFLLFYLLCGVIAVGVHVTIYPSSDLPLVGASGAIAGVLGAYLVFYPRAKVVTFIPLFFLIEVPAFLFLLVWIALQLWSGTHALPTAAAEEASGVAFFAHIGGFAAGLALGPLLRPQGAGMRRKPRSRG